MNPPRIATVADAAAIAQVHVTSWRKTYRGLVPDAMLTALSVPDGKVRWERIIADAAANSVHVVEHEGHAVGFGACSAQRDQRLSAQGFDGEVTALYVLRAAQGKGAGRALMRAMAAVLEDRGHRGAALWVLRENAPVRRFYERLGGRLVGEKEDVRGSGVLHEVAYGWDHCRGLGGE